MTTTLKTCFKCCIEQPIGEFYKHKEMADGHLNKCKSCAKRDTRTNRADNLDYYRAYDRQRGNRQTGDYRERYKKANPEKRAAHCAVGNAVRDGRLKKPSACQDCGASGIIHGHHDDYSRPLDVVWVCPSCHGARHKLCGECWLEFGTPGCRCHLKEAKCTHTTRL